MSEYPKSITTALHAIMSKASYVQKRDKNQFHNYKYAGEAALLEVVRPAMLEAGLILIPSCVDRTPIDEHGNTHITMEYTLAHVSGDVWPDKVRVFGSGNDRNSKGGVGDKGTYKAITGANKYLLFKLLQIETGDDPEATETAAANAAEKPAKDHGQARGPLGITELKSKLKAFVGDLAACGDYDELIGLLNHKDTMAILSQGDRDVPGWMHTKPDSDVIGIHDRIEARKEELSLKADAKHLQGAAE